VAIRTGSCNRRECHLFFEIGNVFEEDLLDESEVRRGLRLRDALKDAAKGCELNGRILRVRRRKFEQNAKGLCGLLGLDPLDGPQSPLTSENSIRSPDESDSRLQTVKDL
jgi:hypothetical protein